MNYMKIIKDDLINGSGVRCTLFVSGCSHGCAGCYSPHTWDYRSGTPFGEEQLNTIREELSKSYVDGLTLLGGDALMPKNINTILELCKIVKNEFPTKNIWCWTGYTLEEIQKNHAYDILNYVDVLIDGKFVEELKNLQLPFRGSENQRILIKGKHYE